MKFVKPIATIVVVFLILSCFVYVKSSPGEQNFFSISPSTAWEKEGLPFIRKKP